MRSMAQSVAGMGALVVSAAAFAGPDWNEGGSDAGSTVGTQRHVSSAGGGTATASARGSTSVGLGTGDLVDIIELDIDNPAGFKFSPSFSTAWDARLFLFRGSGSTSDPIGEPLLCVDNAASGSPMPMFDNTAGQMNTLFTEMGEVFTPGRYLIAITGTGIEPFYTSTGGTTEVVFYVPAVGVGKRRSSSPIWFWPTATTSTVGAWRFNTLGVQFIPADDCEDAEYVFGVGTREIDNTTASDTVGWVDECAITGRDVWYRLFLDCGGTVRITTCGTVTFDSVISVYTGSCEAPVYITCSDDFAGCAGNSSYLEFTGDPCVSGEYLVRVGSWQYTLGGTGTISFECITPPPSADLNGDGVVNGVDLGILLTQWN